MAPSAIVAAGVGTAGAVLAGLGLPLAAVAGVVVYGGWVLARMPRSAPRSPDGPIEPRRLRQPWRHYIREALDAEQRFARAIDSTGAGPLRERLGDIGARVAEGVRECWRIANRGQQLEDALGQLGSIDQLTERLRALESAPPSPTNERLASALRAQTDTYRRIERTAIEARDRLQLLEARLDETVARAVELSLRAGDPIELGGLDDDVTSVVAEMEALRKGLDETAGQAMAM